METVTQSNNRQAQQRAAGIHRLIGTTAALKSLPLPPADRRPSYDLTARNLDNVVAAMGGLHVSTPRTQDERVRAWPSGEFGISTHAIGEGEGLGRLPLTKCPSCGVRYAAGGDLQHTAPHRPGQPGHRR